MSGIKIKSPNSGSVLMTAGTVTTDVTVSIPDLQTSVNNITSTVTTLIDTTSLTTITPALQDNSRNIATTAFVSTARGNFNTATLINGTYTFSSSDIGKIFTLGSATGTPNLTLPSYSSVPIGSVIWLTVADSNGCTVLPNGTDTILNVTNAGTMSSLSLTNSASIALITSSVTGVWTVFGTTGTVYQPIKAWVNFDGTTTTPSIRSSYNVSSVTKNATGDYTINFTNPITDPNYAVSFAGTDVGNGTEFPKILVASGGHSGTPETMTTNAIRVGGTTADWKVFCVTIMR